MSLTDRSEQLLEDLARVCRDVYIAERQAYETSVRGKTAKYRPGPKWDGGVTSSGARTKPIWPKIAKFMLQHNLDPQRCIQYRFMQQSQGLLRPVLPNQIALRKYLEDYRNMTEELRRGLRTTFDTEKAFCRGRLIVLQSSGDMSLAEALDTVLLNEEYPLSPLFRYTLARETRRKTVSRRYRRQALAQYLRFPDDYDEIWGDVIPELFRVSARAVVSNIVGQKSNA